MIVVYLKRKKIINTNYQYVYLRPYLNKKEKKKIKNENETFKQKIAQNLR